MIWQEREVEFDEEVERMRERKIECKENRKNGKEGWRVG